MQLDLTTLPKSPKTALQTPQDVTNATSTLSTLNATLKALQTEKEKVTKPLNEALRQERARFKPFEDQLYTLIDTYKSLLTTYATEQEAIQRQQEAKILQDKRTNTATKVNQLATIDQAPTKAQSDTGSITFTTLTKYRLNTTPTLEALLLLIRNNILTLDTTALKAYLKSNPLPDAIEQYQEKSLRNYTKPVSKP